LGIYYSLQIKGVSWKIHHPGFKYLNSSYIFFFYDLKSDKQYQVKGENSGFYDDVKKIPVLYPLPTLIVYVFLQKI
jgi:hypothetical protein